MTAKGALDSHEEELHWAAHWANATKTIAGYPFLKALLKDFADLRPSRRIENVFFYLCSYNNPELVGFEEFLGKFWTKLGPKDSRDLSRRASSNNGEESSSVLMEGLLARHFSSRISIENIKLHPLLSNGKQAHLRVSFGRRIVYYEISSLGTGKFDAQLKTVYGILSKIVLDSLPSNFEVWIHVDPVKFPKNDLNQLDVNMAISQMNDCLDRLNLRMLWGPDGPLPIHLNLESLSHLPNDKESIYDHHQKRFGPFPFSMLNHYDKLLAKVIDKEPVRSWARMVTPSMIRGSPIVSLSIMPSVRRFAHIGSFQHSPSIGANLEAEAFVEHCRRKIRDKLSSNQREPNMPNILAVRAFNWLYSPYSKVNGLSARDFGEVTNAIHQELEKAMIPDLSAIKIYENDYSLARTIINTFSAKHSRLSESQLANL